jgi:hypothetical protein
MRLSALQPLARGILAGEFTACTFRAWTGGSHPRRFLAISELERVLRHQIFRANMAVVFAYWGDYRGLNPTALEMARIQYRRAAADAHATMRPMTGN